MTDYPYDPDLPYVVTHGTLSVARFYNPEHAREFRESRRFKNDYTVIDTTPAPRVPEDAEYITWEHSEDGYRLFAWPSDLEGLWFDDTGSVNVALEDLPGVTPDTVFTVLDAREERKN